MDCLTHRDMTSEERAQVEGAARVESHFAPGWSSHTVAVMILLSGSFVAGLIFFGLPATFLLSPNAGPEIRDLVLFMPGLLTLLVGGSWSVLYYERGSWRVRRELLDDLDYGRVEVFQGIAKDAWVIETTRGTTWLLDVGEQVLLLAPSAAPAATPRVFPGRRLHLVRCKHSGLVLHLDVDGPALAPTSHVSASEVHSLESARFKGPLEDVCRKTLHAA